MRIAVVGGGPGRPLLLDPDAQARAGLRGHGVRTQPRRRRVRLRRRLLRRDADGVRTRRPGELRRDRGALRAVERHRHPPPRIGYALRRPWLLGARQAGIAGHPPGAGRVARRRAAVRVRGSAAGRAGVGGPDRRRRRRLERDPVGVDRRVRTLARPTVLPLHVAGDRPRVRCVQVRHRGDAARGLPGPRISLRRPDEHVHRRDERGGVAARRACTSWRRVRCRRASATRPASSSARRCSPTRSRAIRCSRTTRSGSTSSRSATADGAPTTSCCSAMPRTPRTSRSARGRSWRWRMRWRWRGRFARSATTSRLRPRRTRPSAARSSRAPSAPRRRRSNGSRGSGGTSTRSATQFAFNLLTRSRRVTYDNLRLRDPEFVQEVDDRFAARGDFRAGRRCSPPSACASWSSRIG